MITLLNHNSENWSKYNVLFEQAWNLLKDEELLTSRDYASATDTDNPKTTFSNIQHYLSYIEQLVDKDSKYLLLPIDEAPFKIDANTRQIEVPADFIRCGGVQSDNYAEIATFTIDRYFDYQDLANTNIAVQWINETSKEQGVSYIHLKDYETLGAENKIRFGWPLTAEMTAAAGTLKFAVRFYTSQTETIEGKETLTFNYILNTSPAAISIHPTLNIDFNDENTIKVDKDYSIFTKFVTNSQNPSYATPTPVHFAINNVDSSVTTNLPETGTIDVNPSNDDLTLVAHAITADANPLEYEWYYKSSEDAPEERLVTGETEEDRAKQFYSLSEGYYEEYTPSVWPTTRPTMVNFWIGEGETKTLYRGEWPGAQPSGSEALYIRKSSLYIKPEAEVVVPDGQDKPTVTGEYYVKAFNRIRDDGGEIINESSQTSSSCLIAPPADIAFKEGKNLVGHAFLSNLKDRALEIEIEKDGKTPTRTYTLIKDGVAQSNRVSTSDTVKFALEEDGFGLYSIHIDSKLNRVTKSADSVDCWVTDHPVVPGAKRLVAKVAGQPDTEVVNNNKEIIVNAASADIIELVVEPYGFDESYTVVEKDAVGNDVERTVNITRFNQAETLSYSWEVQVADAPQYTKITDSDAGKGIIASDQVNTNALTVKVLDASADKTPSTQVYSYKCTVTNTIGTESQSEEFFFTIQ